MTERITPAMVTNTTLNDINSSLAAMERTSNELSSGKTILEPSDNPYGASQVINLQSQLDGLSSYATNAQEGISWESTAGSATSWRFVAWFVMCRSTTCDISCAITPANWASLSAATIDPVFTNSGPPGS